MSGSSNVKLLADDGKRLDGREYDELREIKITPGVLKRVDGSAYIEWGKNKILAAVYGPRECIPRHDSDPYRAVVRCRYLMAPFSSLEEHGRSGPNRRSMEISDVIKETFENVIIVENYPRTAIDIFIEVLEGNGSTRCVGLTAASVALVAAGIPAKDLPVAISVGKINGKIAVDMAKEEDNFGEADMAVAVRPGNKEILLLQMDGKLTRDELEQSFDLIYKAVDEVRVLQVEALKSMYEKQAAEVEAEGNGNDEQGSSSTAESLAAATMMGEKLSDMDPEATEVEGEPGPKDLSHMSADDSEIIRDLPKGEDDLPDLG
jgi:exosome complex component RRP41